MHHAELARAKVNLTLRVLGRRPDGYHEIESLVAFADIGDTVTLQRADTFAFATNAPHIPEADNLVLRAADLFFARYGRQPVRLTLDKRLPIAAGIGGGSADAAATLRLLARTCPQATTTDLIAMARRLGADVPVCLASETCLMRGTGERLEPVTNLAPMHAVLVNARGPVPPRKTAAVFARLAAPALPAGDAPRVDLPVDRRLDTHGNDLEAAARDLMPAIATVIDALRRTGAAIARLSGAGPTCFGLYAMSADAEAAARRIAVAQPTWWVVSTRLS